MTATQRIRSMLDGSPVKEIGACGWLHTIGADRDTAEVFSSAIIKMTDYSKWDFIKVMPNGVYNQMCIRDRNCRDVCQAPPEPPLCEAGQLNIAALVSRWIDGH